MADSINRNIVECKGKYALNGLFCIDVLIETSWNVKKIMLAASFASILY